MLGFSKGNLPSNFDGHFNSICNSHSYGTRAASKTTFCLPLIRTNYGKFNIRFCGPKLWNTIDESFESLSVISFKKKLKIIKFPFINIKLIQIIYHLYFLLGPFSFFIFFIFILSCLLFFIVLFR